MRELPKEFEKPKIDRFEILFPDLVEKWDRLKKEQQDKNEQKGD